MFNGDVEGAGSPSENNGVRNSNGGLNREHMAYPWDKRIRTLRVV